MFNLQILKWHLARIANTPGDDGETIVSDTQSYIDLDDEVQNTTLSIGGQAKKPTEERFY